MTMMMTREERNVAQGTGAGRGNHVMKMILNLGISRMLQMRRMAGEAREETRATRGDLPSTLVRGVGEATESLPGQRKIQKKVKMAREERSGAQGTGARRGSQMMKTFLKELEVKVKEGGRTRTKREIQEERTRGLDLKTKETKDQKIGILTIAGRIRDRTEIGRPESGLTEKVQCGTPYLTTPSNIEMQDLTTTVYRSTLNMGITFQDS